MSQSLSQLYVHLVFNVKSKYCQIPKELSPELSSYIAQICLENESKVLRVGGPGDHLHILLILSKNITLSVSVNKIKSNSSRWLKTKSNDDNLILSKFSWSRGFGAFSVSASQLPVLKKYIENQETHHKKFSFREEYEKLLIKYNVEFERKYLWE